MDFEPISYTDIENTFSILFESLHTDKSGLSVICDSLKKQRALEESIKSINELRTNTSIPEEHCPKRLAIFLLNFYGESACNNRTLTIMQDDPAAGKARHDNVYQLRLKDIDTHMYLYPNNPKAVDLPYDFDLVFKQQITSYDNGNITDTTNTAWDSFNRRYQQPRRTADFKSALWKSGKNTHGVNYTVSIDSSGSYLLRDTAGNKKVFIISDPDPCQAKCHQAYLDLLKKLTMLDGCSWDDIIVC